MPFNAGNFALKVFVLQLLKDQAIYLFVMVGKPGLWLILDSGARQL